VAIDDKVEIDDDDAGTIVAETRPLKPAVIKELAWASLYTKVMHKDIGAISTAIKKSKPTAAGPELKKGAEKLRDQLKSANRTVTELSDHAGLRPPPPKGDPPA